MEERRGGFLLRHEEAAEEAARRGCRLHWNWDIERVNMCIPAPSGISCGGGADVISATAFSTLSAPGDLHWQRRRPESLTNRKLVPRNSTPALPWALGWELYLLNRRSCRIAQQFHVRFWEPANLKRQKWLVTKHVSHLLQSAVHLLSIAHTFRF